MKKGPLFLIAFLLIVLFFILGVRYGQKVEKVNKTMNYYLSLPPSQPPITQIPLKFETYALKGCAIKFLYPVNLKIEAEATYSALFSENKKEVMNINCDAKNKLAEILGDNKTATTEGKITTFKVFNSISGKYIYFSLTNSLYPLINFSLKFSN